MIFDLAKPMQASTDEAFLHALLTTMVGQLCVRVDLSYGDELMLHVGEPLSYAHPKLADEKKGSWILATRASSWRILLSDPPALVEYGWLPPEPTLEKLARESIDGTEAERRAAGLEGRVVRDIRLLKFQLPTPIGVGMGLVVNFGVRDNLLIVPSPEADLDENPVADWELFTPFHMYLKVGPGLVWSYVPSGSPSAAPATP